MRLRRTQPGGEMIKIRARHVVCILHDKPRSLKKLVERFPDFTFDDENSIDEPDERMTDAFQSSSDRLPKTMSDSDWAGVDDHEGVAYVLSPPITEENAITISMITLLLVEAAFTSGARAVKSDSAGLAHGHKRWLDLARRARDVDYRSEMLYRAWVQRPIGDDDELYSCGMHLLGQRDVKLIGFGSSNSESKRASKIIDHASLHLLADGESALKEPLKIEGESFTSQRTPCDGYEEDDFLFNPHGYLVLKRSA
jgi:hypothetical protein